MEIFYFRTDLPINPHIYMYHNIDRLFWGKEDERTSKMYASFGKQSQILGNVKQQTKIFQAKIFI